MGEEGTKYMRQGEEGTILRGQRGMRTSQSLAPLIRSLFLSRERERD